MQLWACTMDGGGPEPGGSQRDWNAMHAEMHVECVSAPLDGRHGGALRIMDGLS